MRDAFGSNQLHYPSNMLSLSRLALVGPTIYYLVRDEPRKALGAITFSMLTDVIDGPLARRRGEVSELGKLIDPLADKLTLDAVAVVLSLKRDFPWWVTYLLLARDAAIIAGATLIFRRTTYVTPSILSGKLTTALLTLALLLHIVDAQPWGRWAIYALLIPLGISWVQYGIQAWQWQHGVRQGGAYMCK